VRLKARAHALRGALQGMSGPGQSQNRVQGAQTVTGKASAGRGFLESGAAGERGKRAGVRRPGVAAVAAVTRGLGWVRRTRGASGSVCDGEAT